jgi:hypothetical protein
MPDLEARDHDVLDHPGVKRVVRPVVEGGRVALRVDAVEVQDRELARIGLEGDGPAGRAAPPDVGDGVAGREPGALVGDLALRRLTVLAAPEVDEAPGPSESMTGLVEARGGVDAPGGGVAPVRRDVVAMRSVRGLADVGRVGVEDAAPLLLQVAPRRTDSFAAPPRSPAQLGCIRRRSGPAVSLLVALPSVVAADRAIRAVQAHVTLLGAATRRIELLERHAVGAPRCDAATSGNPAAWPLTRPCGELPPER